MGLETPQKQTWGCGCQGNLKAGLEMGKARQGEKGKGQTGIHVPWQVPGTLAC